MPTAEADLQTLRKTYLGGSDAAAVLGRSRWKTPLQVWGEKTGNIVPENRDHALPVKVGKRLEELVADLWAEENGAKVARVNDVQFDAEYKFLGAQIDRRVVGTDDILECKTASGWKADEWEGAEIPEEYLFQCHHQLMVTGKARCHIAVLLGGNQDFIYKTIERDEDLIRRMREAEVYFWHEFVEKRVMPGMITANDQDVLYKLFPTANENVLALDGNAQVLIDTIKAHEVARDGIEEKIDEAKNQLRAILGEASGGETASHKVTWKNQTALRLDTDRIKAEAPELYTKYGKEVASRVLRIAAIKAPKKK